MADLALPSLDLAILALLALGAFFAGLVDAVVGGGGLVQIPLLFSAFPNTSPAVIFGTNKLASVVGTSSAAYQYTRRIDIDWTLAAPAIGAAFVASWLGARSVALLPPATLRPLILFLMIVVAIYTFAKKDFGSLQRDTGHSRPRQVHLATSASAVIGFYDGFFGPGTGSFLIFAFIRLLGMDFLRASATAKLVNVATNLAAIVFFSAHGTVLWLAAGLMATANLSGAIVGSRLALRKGTAFVRRVFLLVVVVLIIKLSIDLL
ncbi:MAG: TSUP family transporter [Rhodocyclaceae bacterium]|nr:TSUP family transporter [Rhodocyclaceae bacterium]